jgi:hypothetical protein
MTKDAGAEERLELLGHILNKLEAGCSQDACLYLLGHLANGLFGENALTHSKTEFLFRC